MLDLAGGTTVYLACGATDLRKSYNGLAAVIKLKFQLDPYSRCMFAFCNRRRTLIKILQWDGSGFWILFLRIVYRLDDPYNLFPSLHCFIAWLCWTGIRGNRQVHVLWRVSALLMGIIVCISTLTTRQHVILDAAGGILLSELCWLLAGCNKIRRLYTGLINSVLLTLPTSKTPPC